MNTATAALTRPARISREVRDLLTLALPIMIGQLATTAMSFVDAVMAGRVSPQDLAAVGLGNSIWIPVYLLMSGTLLATTPKVAERYGAGKFTEIGPLVRQSLWLAIVVGIMGGLLLLCAEPILHWMKVEADLIEPSMGYLHGIAAGMPAIALYYVLRCFSDGLGRTRPSMVMGLVGLALNIPLNYIFIYGHLGVPAMGGVGCGWATALSMWAMVIGLAVWTRFGPAYQSSELFKRFDWPQWAVIKRVLGIGPGSGMGDIGLSSVKRASIHPNMSSNNTTSLKPFGPGASDNERRSSTFRRPSGVPGGVAHQSFFQQAPQAAGVPRDPRPLRDRSYQARIGQELLEFLANGNFEMVMSYKLSDNFIKSPTQKDFNTVFKFLYNQIDSNYRFQHYDELHHPV